MSSIPTNTELSDAELLQVGYRFALALTHCSHKAEELIRETWPEMVRKSGRIENRIALFTAIHREFVERFQLNEPITNLSAENSGLDSLLERLHPEEREVIFLRYHERETAGEISEITCTPRRSVARLFRRTIFKLRSTSAS